MATVYTYRFIKESNGNVIIQWLRNGQPFQRFSVQPAKDIRMSLTANGQVIIPIDNNGGVDGQDSIAVPFDRIDFVNSVPSSANPASPNDAVQRLGEDFFYGNSVVGGGAVSSVNGQTGAVVLTAGDVGAPSGSGNSTGTNTGDQDLSGLQLKSIIVASNTNAINDGNYTNVANATYTDPSPPVEGKGFRVMVRNGTATVGGTGYYTPGTVILRIFHSGAWANYVYQVAGGGDSPDKTLISRSGSIGSHTGDTNNTIVFSRQLNANDFAINDTILLSIIMSQTGAATTMQYRVYINSSNTIGGGLIFQSSLYNNTWSKSERTFGISSSTVAAIYPPLAGQNSDILNFNFGITDVTIPDISTQLWIIVAVELANASTTATLRNILLKRRRE